MAAEPYRSDRAVEPRSPRLSGLALDHVQVAAPPGCEAEARAFYGDLLGLAEADKPVGLRARGGVWFALDEGRALHIGVARGDFTPAQKAHPALRARDATALTELATRLQDAGAPVRWAAADETPGAARFFTSDPWGNRLELLSAA